MTTLIDYLGMWKIENQETISFSFLDTVEALLIGYYKDVTTSLEQVEDKDSLSFMLATLADRSSEDGPQASSASIDTTTHAFSGLNVTEDADTKAGSDLKQQNPGTDVLECKCGMPLCICEAPAPVPNPIPLQMQRASTVSAQPIPKPKRINNYSKDISSASNNKARSVTAAPVFLS
ncbi:hypothetical protein GIB67_026428 [Kingdonia uniflora]|uniref:Uncharacterized protein n=1 Tax=Kingdonia uniflora TaxID=39325 RepID=A0A7J7P6G8_9MAGN|nr:hypothetical protein GIB67_026428 [Kingdonia uniflora]